MLNLPLDFPAARKAAFSREVEMDFKEPGYERLADVLHRAYQQAAVGKGKERHAQGEPFHEQVMQTGAQRFGVGALLFQAFKKSEESQRLPVDRGVAELLGAINYLAGAVIAREAQSVDAEQARRSIPADAQFTNPFTSQPRDARDVMSDPYGLLIVRDMESMQPAGFNSGEAARAEWAQAFDTAARNALDQTMGSVNGR